jgi:hypothetical protein
VRNLVSLSKRRTMIKCRLNGGEYLYPQESNRRRAKIERYITLNLLLNNIRMHKAMRIRLTGLGLYEKYTQHFIR